MSKNKFHYVYAICNKITRKCYIGSRSSKIKSELDLGIKYISSSKDNSFIQEQKTNKSNFKYLILKTFDNRTAATEYEIFLHNLFNVGENENFYNKAKQTSKGFCAEGYVTVKDNNNIIQYVPLNDYRYLSGELVHNCKDQVVVKNHDDNCIRIPKDDPRYLSGELRSPNFGIKLAKYENGEITKVNIFEDNLDGLTLISKIKNITVIDKHNNITIIQENDPKYLSGELTKHHTKIISDEHKQKISNTLKNNSKRKKQIAISNIETKQIKFIDSNEIIPYGWVHGFQKQNKSKNTNFKSSTFGKICLVNIITGKLKYINPNEQIPENYKLRKQ